MRYEFPVEVAPDVDKATPTKHTCKVCRGKLTEVSITFPWGCAGLVGLRIKHYEHILYPSNTDEWFVGNDIVISFQCDYTITQGNNYFHVEVYSDDDFYTHTPVVAFTVLGGDSVGAAAPRIVGV